MNDAIAAWEDEGGSAAQVAERPMIGTENQVEWAERIKTQVDAEFDRVRRVLEAVDMDRPDKDRVDIQAILHILEDRRAEVMRNERAGYFIHDWQEMRDQVRRLILEDPRYKALKIGRPGRSSRTADNSSPKPGKQVPVRPGAT